MLRFLLFASISLQAIFLAILCFPTTVEKSGICESGIATKSDCKMQSLGDEKTQADQAFIDEVVKRHNELRSIHGSHSLSEDKDITVYAQEWADYLAKSKEFKHRSGNKYGENLSWMWTSATGMQHVDFLYSKEQEKYANNGFYEIEPTIKDFNGVGIGHFTQIVWASTRRIGVGKADGIVAINYDPPGNMLGQFSANVKPPKH